MTMTAELEAADILLCLAKVGQNLEQTVKDQNKDDPTDIHDIINGAMQVKNEKNQSLYSDESFQRDDALNSRERKSRYNLRNLTKVIYKEANGDQQVQMATPTLSKHQNTNTSYTEWFTSMAAEAQELFQGKRRQYAAKNRALMSAEKRASRAEYMRKYKIAYRASGRDRSRIPRSAMSEEERALARERARQSRARLIARRGVEAFREQHRGYENRYREKMSEEKRIQLAERSRERNRARNRAH